MPFVRQNRLLISMLMVANLVVQTRSLKHVFLYLPVVALPLYHNLDFAGQWRFLVEGKGALIQPTGDLWTGTPRTLSGPIRA